MTVDKFWRQLKFIEQEKLRFLFTKRHFKSFEPNLPLKERAFRLYKIDKAKVKDPENFLSPNEWANQKHYYWTH